MTPARRRLQAALISAFLLTVQSCTFAPDLSRFAACDATGGCPTGTYCLTDVNRCLPACGEGRQCAPPISGEDEDAGTEQDGGTTPDSGEADAGAVDAGTVDAGTQPDGGTTPDAGTAALSLESNLLQGGTETVYYAEQLQARGGTPPYTFNAIAQLPAGFSLGTGGLLTGTPSRAGDVFFPVEVTDASTPVKRASGSLRLSVRPVLRLAGPAPLADAPRKNPYTETVSATGGKAPYRFALVPEQSLPAGLTLAANGGFEGTTEQEGLQTFTVVVTDSDTPPQSASRTLSIALSDVTAFVKLLSRGVPDGRVGSDYAYVFQTISGTNSFTWSIKDGALPPGILLDSKKGILSGKPTAAGDFTFMLNVQDLLSSTQQGYTLHVD
ncbi:cadherin repeat domain-containing protein [Corallococcus praedator]|uniref:Cadherin repeat domain-containing protein n=1 Tax=Corallococcus praedator TaxID=2316724 RepID=A0ABX9QKP2_9BACT|nr:MULTISPECIES: Ig domain-containing protein [Corallococcus]RKH33497.1 cadherin repeat domain-containing protein [Corallococcus sp. CA031C]RKI11687.1 cadherin repeat domain-containing protein [Corallococcus praedator]